jgi:hypothetical protein
MVTIEPAATRITEVEADDPNQLRARLGLEAIDHAVVMNPVTTGIGIGIMVIQFGLFVPPDQQRYFAINRSLYGGNAILYGFNEAGVTIDLQMIPPIVFMSLKGVEEAIASGALNRPFMAVNDLKIWEWPGPAPFSIPNPKGEI